MDEHTKEKLGLLCRWTLLALTAGIAPAVVAAALPVAARPRSAAPVRLVLPDQLAGPPNAELYGLVAYADPPPPGRLPAFLGGCTGEAALLMVADGVRQFLHVPGLPAGEYELRAAGVPYGPAAYDHDAARLRVVEADATVVFLDGLTFRRSVLRDADGLRAMVRAAERLGACAVWHAGTLDAYVALRLYVRRRGYGVPVICPRLDPPPERLDRALRAAYWSAGRRPDRRGVFVTGDAAVARLAAEMGFTAYLVGPGRGGVAEPGLRGFAWMHEVAKHLETSADSR